MKRLKELIILALIGGIMVVSGCLTESKPSRNDISKELLEKKYNEEFNVYSIESQGQVWYAECSPVNNPEVVFKARFTDNVEEVDEDNYENSYLAFLLNEQFKKDLDVFFPGASFHTNVEGWREKHITDLKNESFDELITNIEKESNNIYGAELFIFYDKNVGSAKLYEEEYEYFTDTVDELIEMKKMLPITVSIFKVDKETITRVNEYYKNNIYEGEYYFVSEVLMVDSYKLGLYSCDSSDLGNPPNIVACFKKDAPMYIENINEYIRRREMLENVH